MSRSAIFSAARASGKSFLRSDNVFVNAKKPSLQRNIQDLTRRFTTVGVAAKPSTAYPGEPSLFTTDFGFKKTFDTLPTYRIMDEFGKVLDQKQVPQLDKDIVRRMYTSMLQLNAMDGILYNVQRQGRISFYMTHFGEEATHVGSAAALSPEDTIFAQYREAGTLIWRGFTLDEFMNQCYSNEEDYGKGRQMPVHYGSKKINFQTISSPLATQLPQSVGASYAQKLAKTNNCTICYFGEGAASEGDFHAALNFAATLQTPTIFFCRNNRWAISTPSTEQFKGDGIGVRGVAYGIDTIRVDGNDIFAVYNATQQARKMAVEQNRPTVIEAMTYRVSHHSTSDDSTRYRVDKEVEEWKEKFNPILRLKNYMLARNLWTEEEDVAFIKKVKADVLEALKKAEGKKKPHLDELFTDVYDQLPPNLIEQKKELLEHIAKYPEHYPIDQHAS